MPNIVLMPSPVTFPSTLKYLSWLRLNALEDANVSTAWELTLQLLQHTLCNILLTLANQQSVSYHSHEWDMWSIGESDILLLFSHLHSYCQFMGCDSTASGGCGVVIIMALGFGCVWWQGWCGCPPCKVSQAVNSWVAIYQEVNLNTAL